MADFGCNEQEYCEQGKHTTCPRPDHCPFCGAMGSLIGHGSYRRKPKDERQAYSMRIKRWWCKVCHRSLSVLPDFVLALRHYLVRVIQCVVAERFERGRPWGEVKAQCACQGTPALRTMQRWCKAFLGHALPWLGAVQETLAQQDSRSAWLDPQGEAPQAGNPAAALLAASLHLLAWAKTQWPQLARYGWNDRLRFLWLWGSSQDLGRLV